MSIDDSLSPQYEVFKKRLLRVGVAIPGTIHALYALCGSQSCECVKDKSKRHGPYYRWHHHVRGRQVSIGLDEKEVPLFENWIENRLKLESILKLMLEMSATYAENQLLDKKQAKFKSNKTTRSTRGK